MIKDTDITECCTSASMLWMEMNTNILSEVMFINLDMNLGTMLILHVHITDFFLLLRSDLPLHILNNK